MRSLALLFLMFDDDGKLVLEGQKFLLNVFNVVHKEFVLGLDAFLLELADFLHLLYFLFHLLVGLRHASHDHAYEKIQDDHCSYDDVKKKIDLGAYWEHGLGGSHDIWPVLKGEDLEKRHECGLQIREMARI